MTGALCSRANRISIREVHTEATHSNLGLVTWTYEGRLPAEGNASDIWKQAKEKKQLFLIESDNLGPLDCSWKLSLKADFSKPKPPTHVAFRVAPVPSPLQTGKKPDRFLRLGPRSICNGAQTLFSSPASDSFWCLQYDDTLGILDALEISKTDTILQSTNFLTCTMSIEFPATPHGAHNPFPIPPISQYQTNNKLSDITLNIRTSHPPVTIPAHKMVLAANSAYFHSKFDFEERINQPSECDIKDFTEPTIHAMLEFMYTRRIDDHMPQSLDSKLDLIAACEYYQVTGMHQFVAPHILQNIGPGNVIKILATGCKFRGASDALAKGAGKYLRDNWTELGAKEEFSSSLRRTGREICCDMHFRASDEAEAYIHHIKEIW
ncbi:Kelch-like protein 8 [Rhizophlyctis rosea]|uniref:Kelch-like protein 8 n=1 Tax=Rhizophlyctis rosea TaxID=64517 RepID=A0AAD5SE64_9FUNG|nr:Kelch-like protein 8 [Rhizophlyctis rosea]